MGGTFEFFLPLLRVPLCNPIVVHHPIPLRSRLFGDTALFWRCLLLQSKVHVRCVSLLNTAEVVTLDFAEMAQNLSELL